MSWTVRTVALAEVGDAFVKAGRIGDAFAAYRRAGKLFRGQLCQNDVGDCQGPCFVSLVFNLAS